MLIYYSMFFLPYWQPWQWRADRIWRRLHSKTRVGLASRLVVVSVPFCCLYSSHLAPLINYHRTLKNKRNVFLPGVVVCNVFFHSE